MTRIQMAAGLAAAAMLSVAAAQPAQAAKLRYDITGVGSGVLDGAAFDEQAFDIAMFGDPASADAAFGVLKFIDPLASADVSIGGGAPVTVGLPTRLGLADFGGGDGGIFFSRAGLFGSDLFDFAIPVDFGAFDFTGPFVVAALGPAFALDQFQNVGTSGGLLSFNTAHDIVFSISAVPEAGAWMLMVGGFLVLGGTLRRRPLAA